MIQIGSNIIINGDSAEELAEAAGQTVCVITCGLSLKSTITASSIGDTGFTYCIQRSIFTVNKTRLVPQEFNIRWHRKPLDIYPCLEVVTALLLCDTPIEEFDTFVF